MKGIDIFCASQAATAICFSMEQHSSSSPSTTILLGGGGGSGKAIDRHNPIIRDSRRTPKSLPPCTTTSQPPLSPKPHKLHHNKKKNQKTTFNDNENQPKKTDVLSSLSKLDHDKIETRINDGNAIVKKSWRCTKPGDSLSPPTPSSTRYLLREKVFDNGLLDSDSTKFSVEESFRSNDVKTEEPSSLESSNQVVVLRVSLHCRGCERKLRKHLSKMEGVTSFNIDFKAKKVTVNGNVTPLGVLSSISKVKNAQLWSPTVSSSIQQSLNLSNSELENDNKGAGA